MATSFCKMNWIEQPEDMLIEQLLYLSIEDLQAVCRTNRLLHSVYNRPTLWMGRLQREFPEQLIAPDPREQYLRPSHKRAVEQLADVLERLPLFPVGQLRAKATPHWMDNMFQPISRLGRLVIDYGIAKITYPIDRPIGPLDVLGLVDDFYEQPLCTQDEQGRCIPLAGVRISDLYRHSFVKIQLGQDLQIVLKSLF